MATNIYMRMLLSERIKLEPSFLHKQYRDEVARRLKLKVEGICSRHGFIRPDSIEIHKICIGKVELVGLNGNIEFEVVFYADVCNPMLGSVIKCRVSNINKFGILAEAENVIETIIAKNSVNIQSDIDLDKVRIGDDILIEVVGKKYELNERKISLIGRVVRDTSASRKSLASSVEDGKSKKILLDEVVDTEDIEGEEDEDADADVRSLVGGAKSDTDSEEDANSEADEEDDDEAEAEAEADADEAEEADSDIFSEGGDGDGDDEAKHNGNFFSDDEEPAFGGSDEEGSFEDDEDAQVFSDDE
jgi:DNA-directed RNA polymerase subunit E'/Rpb7